MWFDGFVEKTGNDIGAWSPFGYAGTACNFNISIMGEEKYRVEFLKQYIKGRLDDSNLVVALDYSGNLASKFNSSVDVAKEGIKMDLFRLIDFDRKFSSEAGKDDYFDDCLVSVQEFVCVLLGIEVFSLESACLEKAIRACVFRCREQGNVPTLRDLVDELRKNDKYYKLGLGLESTINNNFDALNGSYNVNVFNGFVVLDFSGIKDVKRKSILTAYILTNILLVIKSIGSRLRKNIIIHDAWEIKGENVLLLERIARGARKLCGSLVCSDPALIQEKAKRARSYENFSELAGDFQADYYLQNIFNAANWECYFKQGRDNIRLLRRLYSDCFVDAEISNLKKGEYVMKGCREFIKGEINSKEME